MHFTCEVVQLCCEAGHGTQIFDAFLRLSSHLFGYGVKLSVYLISRLSQAGGCLLSHGVKLVQYLVCHILELGDSLTCHGIDLAGSKLQVITGSNWPLGTDTAQAE